MIINVICRCGQLISNNFITDILKISNILKISYLHDTLSNFELFKYRKYHRTNQIRQIR